MSDKDWAKEMEKIDKQLESVADDQIFPDKPAAPPADASRIATERTAVTSWPALLRLGLAVALGVGILFWPYANRCGIGLAGYLFAVIAVVAGGVWSAVWTWRHRAASAHVLSVLLIVWGLMLGATEVLPRVGYAKAALPWTCMP